MKSAYFILILLGFELVAHASMHDEFNDEELRYIQYNNQPLTMVPDCIKEAIMHFSSDESTILDENYFCLCNELHKTNLIDVNVAIKGIKTILDLNSLSHDYEFKHKKCLETFYQLLCDGDATLEKNLVKGKCKTYCKICAQTLKVAGNLCVDGLICANIATNPQRGPIGNRGTQGATGQTGATGETGVTGSTGFTGFTGPQGAQGALGSTGFTGNTGNTGFTGFTGNTGSRGAVGAQGNTGNMGPRGATGLAGAAFSPAAYGFFITTGSTGPIATNQIIPFAGAAQPPVGMSLASSQVTIATTGTYEITFIVTADASPSALQLEVNGAPQSVVYYGQEFEYSQNYGQAILSLVPGDVVSLVNRTTSPITLNGNLGGTSIGTCASLLIRRIF